MIMKSCVNHFTVLLFGCILISSSSATLSLLPGLSSPLPLLPTLAPLKIPTLPELEALKPASSGGLFSSLGLPTLPSLNFFSSTPCLGSTSFKSGKCQKADACQSGGGFADGKGLCLLDQVCCLEAMKCGGKTESKESAIASDKYPDYMTTAGHCSVVIKKLPNVVAIRIDFDVLELAAPDNRTGECTIDALTVEGVDKGFELGKICGINNKGHIYLSVGKSEQKEVLINLALSDTQQKRRWLMRVTQFVAGDPKLPPPGCVQYFTETSGVLSSFNFDVNEKQGKGNIAGLKYASCIKKAVGFCKIAFEAIFFDMSDGSFVDEKENIMNTNKFARYALNTKFVPRVDYRRLNRYQNLNHFRPLMKEPLFNYQIRPLQNVKYHSSYIDPSKMSPYVHPLTTSTSVIPQELNTIVPSMDGKLDLLNELKASIADILAKNRLGTEEPKISSLINESGKLNETFESSNNIGSFNPGMSSSLCKNEDIIILPPLDEGIPSLFCKKQLPVGPQLTSSYSPFVVTVHNKGAVHGKGFAIMYKQLIC